MSGTYKIKGTLQVTCTVDETRFSIFPDTTYLSPDKKSAVLYLENNKKACIVKINSADGKTLSFGSLKNLGSEGYLVQIALQNKPVELHLNESCETITGFTYPAR